MFPQNIHFLDSGQNLDLNLTLPHISPPVLCPEGVWSDVVQVNITQYCHNYQSCSRYRRQPPPPGYTPSCTWRECPSMRSPRTMGWGSTPFSGTSTLSSARTSTSSSCPSQSSSWWWGIPLKESCLPTWTNSRAMKGSVLTPDSLVLSLKSSVLSIKSWFLSPVHWLLHILSLIS